MARGLAVPSLCSWIPPCAVNMCCCEDGMRKFLFSLYSRAAQRGSRSRFQPQLPHFLGVSGGISIWGPQVFHLKISMWSQVVAKYALTLKLCFSGSAVCCLVPQSYPAVCDPMDCSPPDSSVHGILQARMLDCHSLLHPRSRDGKVLWRSTERRPCPPLMPLSWGSYSSVSPWLKSVTSCTAVLWACPQKWPENQPTFLSFSKSN